MDGTVMRMRPVQSLAIPAGHQIALSPGGQHLMLFGLDAPFTEGEEIAVQLTFETAGVVEILLPVRRAPRHAHTD
jgi:copper(I)-binding protein